MIRRATDRDAGEITALVQEAYEKYVARIGMRPVPMDENYAELVAQGKVYVVGGHRIDGVLVLEDRDDHLYLDNVAVRPAVQGTGVGRALLEFTEAEARRRGYDAVELFTNAKMTENRALYARIGYAEVEEAVVAGRNVVRMRKGLG